MPAFSAGEGKAFQIQFGEYRETKSRTPSNPGSRPQSNLRVEKAIS